MSNFFFLLFFFIVFFSVFVHWKGKLTLSCQTGYMYVYRVVGDWKCKIRNQVGLTIIGFMCPSLFVIVVKLFRATSGAFLECRNLHYKFTSVELML